MPDFGGCVWPVDSACLTDEWDAFSAEVQARALGLASATLERLTGYRVRNCPITVRPCKRGCSPESSYLNQIEVGRNFTPHINTFGNWVNSCGCTTDCACTALCEVVLPTPVGRVDEVKVNGSVVTDWRVDGDRLVWTGTTACPWPACQDLALPDTEDNTFSITYLNAYPVDALGSYAAGLLAVEYGRACSGGSCRLPLGVTMIVRQGITMEIASGAFPGGATGIREVDAFIALWNPQGLRQGTTVYSPDRPRTRVTTIGGPA